MKNFLQSLLLFIVLAVPDAAAIRIKQMPFLQNVTETEATIVWMSDKISVGWVEISADDDTHFYHKERTAYWDSRHGIKAEDTLHVVRLTGLKPGTRYRYRVFAREVLSHESYHVRYGDAAATDVWSRRPLSFVTRSAAAPATTFAVVNDLHGNNPLLEKLIGQCDLKTIDGFLFNGDMVSHFDSQRQVFDGFLNTAIRLFASEIPFYYIRGNHETRGTFAPRFHDYFSPRQEHTYYAFRQGPVYFVMLDTGEDKPDTDIEYSGITDYDRFRSEEAGWLKEIVAGEAYRSAPYRVVVAHIPPGEGWHGNVEVMNKFVSLLRQAPPTVMLCGHEHRFQHTPASAEVPFPVIVNSNKHVLKVKADAKGMHIDVCDADGKTVEKIALPPR